MEMFSKWATRVMSAIFTGLKIALVVGAVVGTVMFLGAPSLFGIVFITAGIVATVVTYTAVAFAIGFLAKLFRLSGRKLNVVNFGNPAGTK
jgi:hypothetical protein